MANQHDKRDWSVLARFPFSKWSCSAFMTYTQAKLLADALEHVDHIIAVVDGGTDDEANLQPLCRPCNRRKGPQAWARKRRGY